ncbi:MAG TPA: Xaa-Pro peptidase family protein [Alphaproteobacteria bacterium]|nr:Xaa-Pro peptidase family protein [Alphaproteobacteria bacterium]
MLARQSEMIANVPRLHNHMDRDGCAALVVRSGKNVTYLAGFAYPGTLARHLDFPDSPREVLLVWPRHDEPVLIVNHYAAPLARRDSWLRRIEIYDDYAESPYARMAEVLTQMGLDRETVGFEKTYLSAVRWQEIRGLLPEVRMVDCTDMMAQVRWIKTPGEIARLKAAADLLDEAYLEVFPTVMAGETEREVHSRLVASCIRRGAQWAHGILNSSRNTVAYGGEGDTVFQPGDIIRNDYVAYYRGYPGHQSRTVILGRPSEEQKNTYVIMRDIYRRTIEQCRVGVPASAIHAFAAEQFRRHGYSDRVSLVGHGVGPWWHQQEPYLVSTCQQRLEDGMVLALEPHVGYWHLQDLMVVTQDGPQLLSDRFNTDDMFVID